MNEKVKCHCGKLEYNGEMTWLSGQQHCRDCYKKRYKEVNKAMYRWTDKEYTEEELADLERTGGE